MLWLKSSDYVIYIHLYMFDFHLCWICIICTYYQLPIALEGLSEIAAEKNNLPIARQKHRERGCRGWSHPSIMPDTELPHAPDTQGNRYGIDKV